MPPLGHGKRHTDISLDGASYRSNLLAYESHRDTPQRTLHRFKMGFDRNNLHENLSRSLSSSSAWGKQVRPLSSNIADVSRPASSKSVAVAHPDAKKSAPVWFGKSRTDVTLNGTSFNDCYTAHGSHRDNSFDFRHRTLTHTGDAKNSDSLARSVDRGNSLKFSSFKAGPEPLGSTKSDTRLLSLMGPGLGPPDLGIQHSASACIYGQPFGQASKTLRV